MDQIVYGSVESESHDKHILSSWESRCPAVCIDSGTYLSKLFRYRPFWFLIAVTIVFTGINRAAVSRRFAFEDGKIISNMDEIGNDMIQKLSVEVSYDLDDSGLYIPSTDPNSTKSTRALLTGLVQVANMKAIMFGHENTNVEGQYFWDEHGHKYQSDVANATDGGFPAVVGYNAQNIIEGKDWTPHITDAYSRGSVITFYWLSQNPVNGGSESDCTGNPVTELLPGGNGNSNWTENLNKIGSFFKSLRYQGEQIPIIFRLFHECTWHRYWWSSLCAKPSDYVTAWRYTQRYLRDTVGVHNLLYTYAASKVSWYAYETFHIWYPGKDHVDILGFDRYSKEKGYTGEVLEDCQVVVNESRRVGKIAAISETGISYGVEEITTNATSWFEKDFLNPIIEDELCQNVVYVLTFANENPSKYWVPLRNQATHPGFMAMYNSERSIFVGDKRWDTIRTRYGIGYRSDHTNVDGIFEGDSQMLVDPRQTAND